METAGQRLQFARKKGGFKSARVAALTMNVPVSTYNAHERAGEPGARNYKPEDAEKYARFFRVSASWLLFGKDDEPAPMQAPQPPLPASPRPPGGPNASKPVAVPPLSPDKLPVFGRAVGGDEGRFIFNGEVMGSVFCPPMLEGVVGAYAVEVSGESMIPRMRPGETVWVNPRRSVHKGDDVIVQMHPAEEGGEIEGYVKEFVAYTPTRLILKQYNPEIEIEIERAAVISVHKIVFHARI